MGTFTSDLAGNGNFGGYNPVQIFSGEKPVTTNHGNVKGGQNLAKYTVVMLDANGLIVPWAVGAGNNIAGVLAQPIVTAANDDTQMCPYFDGGVFNIELAGLPNGVTLAQLKALQAGKTLNFEKLYG